MGIGPRLQLVLAIPLTALLLVSGFGVHRGATQNRAAAALTERTDLALASYRLIESLEAERQLLVAEDRTTAELRGAVDASRSRVSALAAKVGGDLQVITETALDRVGAAQSVAARELGGAVALRVHSAAIAKLLDVSALAIDPGGAIDDAAAGTTEYLARAQAASSEERDLVQVLVDDQSLDAQSFQEVMGLASDQESYVALAAASAPDALAVQIGVVGFAMSAADTLRRETFDGEADRSQAWIAGLDARTTELATLQRTAEAGAVSAVRSLAADSRLLFVMAGLSAIAIVLVSILLLRRAIRSIARPLQQLAAQAEDVASTRLPDAVAAQQLDGADAVHLPALRASGAAEVHHVADAFNAVQDTALRLAGEQAALRRNQGEALTNLGRRNQTLLARQLDFISSLETRETDPAFLEHLFRLDHLASRMRRNAESLLILAGSETPRRRRTPAPIAEIVRAAMSEVEEFERVRIGNVRDATITGPVVIDLIHLLAELIENALGFSPPDSTVEIDGRSLGQGGYQFAVIDHGVGMTDVELVAANERLRGLDELEGMPTRYLGQYVVAKLAAKTHAMVRLQPSSGGRGVTALVILPSTALVGERDRGSVAQPLPGSRAAREQGPVPFAPGAAMASASAGMEPAAGTGAIESSEPVGFSALADDDRWPALETGSPLDGALSGDPTAIDDRDSADGIAAAPLWEPLRFDRSSAEPLEEPASELRTSEGDPELPSEADLAPQIDHAPANDLARTFQADPEQPSPMADPWQGFFDEGDPTDDPTDALPIDALPTDAVPPAQLPIVDAPPPVPTVAPTQSDWAPAAPVGADATTSEWPDEPVWPAAPVEPAVVAEPAGTSTMGVDPAAATPQSTGGGGLARRVPGASLAESRGAEPGAPAVPAPSRSADGVRSMLSSFQAGRHRGLVEDTTADDQSSSESSEDPSPGAEPTGPAPAFPNSVHDGRFPQ